MTHNMKTTDPHVLNQINTFTTLLNTRFPNYTHPILIHKNKKPKSKQKLTFTHNHHHSVYYDIINHLINNIIIINTTPISIQNIIIYNNINKNLINNLIDTITNTYRQQNYVLTNNETSIQPKIIPNNLYVLTTNILNIINKERIIDNNTIQTNNQIITLASNELHTNNYTLIRTLIDQQPNLLDTEITNKSFLDTILKPHTYYFQPLHNLFTKPNLHNITHITKNNLQNNLNQILPTHLNTQIDHNTLEIPTIFHNLRKTNNLDNQNMMQTFNMGTNIILIIAPKSTNQILNHLTNHNTHTYYLKKIVTKQKKIKFQKKLT